MVDRNTVAVSASILTELPMHLQAIMDRYTQKLRPGSPAANEVAKCGEPQHLEAAFTLAVQRIFVAHDHMVALERTITEPTLTYSPWTCARATLESCSVASWLFEELIGHEDRIGRSFNLRHQNIKSQMAFFRGERPVLQAEIDRSGDRITYLRDEASKIGIPEKLDKNGRFLGFAGGMPSHTEFINKFDAKQTSTSLSYALLSPAAHGEDWAVAALGSQTVMHQTGASRKPELRPEYAILLIIQSVQWIAYPCWEWWKLYGWDLAELEQVLDNAYDRVGMVEPLRFWKQP